MYTNAGDRPRAPEGTTKEKAQVSLSRIDDKLRDWQDTPFVVNGLLRRSCVAKATGLGRRGKSQKEVLEWLVKKGFIQLVMMDNEQWLRRTEKLFDESDGSESDKPVGEEDDSREHDCRKA